MEKSHFKLNEIMFNSASKFFNDFLKSNARSVLDYAKSNSLESDIGFLTFMSYAHAPLSLSAMPFIDYDLIFDIERTLTEIIEKATGFAIEIYSSEPLSCEPDLNKAIEISKNLQDDFSFEEKTPLSKIGTLVAHFAKATDNFIRSTNAVTDALSHDTDIDIVSKNCAEVTNYLLGSKIWYSLILSHIINDSIPSKLPIVFYGRVYMLTLNSSTTKTNGANNEN